jgi:hypothetical protein
MQIVQTVLRPLTFHSRLLSLRGTKLCSKMEANSIV